MTKPVIILMTLTALAALYCVTTGELLEAAGISAVVGVQFLLVKLGF